MQAHDIHSASLSLICSKVRLALFGGVDAAAQVGRANSPQLRVHLVWQVALRRAQPHVSMWRCSVYNIACKMTRSCGALTSAAHKQAQKTLSR